MKKRENKTTKSKKVKNGRPKKQFHIYTQIVDNEKEILVSLKKLDVNSEESKEKDLQFLINSNFHPRALNETLQDCEVSFGERFYWVHRFFKYSIED